MKRLLTAIINFAFNRAQNNRLLQKLFGSRIKLSEFSQMGSFSDSNGNSFILLDGLRSKIKPGWERMFTTKGSPVDKEFLSIQKENGSIAINRILPYLKSAGTSFEDKTVLEIGCNNGASSFIMAEKGAAKVVGSEFAGYKVESMEVNEQNSESKLIEVNDRLKDIRLKLAINFPNREKVTFVDDDICNSNLEPGSFDIICSWDVLEHLHDTENAFSSICNLLKDDGITIHEYNPFFCLNGGHSLCTLDFLWGHTRLNESDFSRYMDEIRPGEKEMAMSFYKKGLNRMTLIDLKNQMENVGLEILSIVPMVKVQNLKLIDQEILSQTQLLYSEVTLEDLSSNRAYVVAKRALHSKK